MKNIIQAAFVAAEIVAIALAVLAASQSRTHRSRSFLGMAGAFLIIVIIMGVL